MAEGLLVASAALADLPAGLGWGILIVAGLKALTSLIDALRRFRA